MNADEALKHCQAYLDQELDAATVAQIDACLAQNPEVAKAYAREREFHAFAKARSAKVDLPPNLAAGIKARMAKVQMSNLSSRPRTILPRRNLWRGSWILAVAGLAVAAAAIWIAAKAFQTPPISPSSGPTVAQGTNKPVVSVQPQTGTSPVPSHFATNPQPIPPPNPPAPKRECPYMVACATEHDGVASGKTPIPLQTEDRSKMSAFFAEKLKLSITDVPALLEYKLKPSGAGIATFANLKRFGAPDAAFVVYNGAEKETVTLLIHPWPKEEPMAMNIVLFEGRKYWVATHGDSSIAAWKSDDGKLVLSMISARSKDENFKMARDARREFNEARPAWLKRAADTELALVSRY